MAPYLFVLLLAAFVSVYIKLYMPSGIAENKDLQFPQASDTAGDSDVIPVAGTDVTQEGSSQAQSSSIPSATTEMYRNMLEELLKKDTPYTVAECVADKNTVISLSGDGNVILSEENNGEILSFVSAELSVSNSISGIKLSNGISHILSTDTQNFNNNGAFAENKVLESFISNINLLYIGNKAFYGCTSLSDVFLHTKLRYIGDRAFYGCKALKKIAVFGETAIGDSAFAGCDSLKEVYLSDSITRVGLGAFEHTPFYENLTAEFCISGGVLLKYNGNASDVVIPDGVRVIADGVFAGKLGIKSVTLPKSVEYIGNSAFRSCVGLTDVFFDRSYAPVIGEYAFEGCPLSEPLTVSLLASESRRLLVTKNDIKHSDDAEPSAAY